MPEQADATGCTTLKFSMQDTPLLSFGSIDVRFSNFGSAITEIPSDAYCYYVDDSGAKSHMFDKCDLISANDKLGFNVRVKAPGDGSSPVYWPEDKLINVKFCNMRFPVGKPAVTVSYKVSGQEVMTSGAVNYDKDLPAKAATLAIANTMGGAITKGFDYSLKWKLSSLGKEFTSASKVTATFPKYYSAELGAGLRCQSIIFPTLFLIIY
jgi:hypothetical protein